MAYSSRATAACAARPEVNRPMSSTVSESIARRPSEPGATRLTEYATIRKIAPPISATSTMARGMVRRGSRVSSVSVLIASKPRNE